MSVDQVPLRRCNDCGVLEDRRRDGQGRETTNISPITNQCVACLVKTYRSFRSRRVMPDPVHDPRAAAARNDE